MAVSKPQDSADQPQPPRSDNEVKRLQDAVLFAWEHLHSVVRKNGGSSVPPILQQTVNEVRAKAQENQAAPPPQQQQRQMQPQTQNQKGSSKNDTTRPTSLNDRTSTKVDRGTKPPARKAQARL